MMMLDSLNKFFSKEVINEFSNKIQLVSKHIGENDINDNNTNFESGN